MSFMNRSVRRVWKFHPASFPIRAAATTAKSWVHGPRPVRMLLASDGVAYTSEQQFAPFGRHAGVLQDRLGLVAQYRKLPDALRMDAATLRSFDVVGFKLVFGVPTEEVARMARHFAERLAGSNTRLVYFDGDDDPNVQWKEVLETVDLYVKKHVHTDTSRYAATFVGKTNLTDYVNRTFGISFADNIVPSSGDIPRELHDKIHLGWNIGLDDKIHALSGHVASLPKPARDIDLSCRAYVPPENWTHLLRYPALDQMQALGDRYEVLAPRERVPQDVYYQEMLRSKICVSPFGAGELCWRDFEAILCGCLLVKPDMGHLRTQPDIFVPDVTYVPVRWGFGDLGERVAPYLADESLRRRVADRARETLLASLEPAWFVARTGELLARLGLLEPAAKSSLVEA